MEAAQCPQKTLPHLSVSMIEKEQLEKLTRTRWERFWLRHALQHIRYRVFSWFSIVLWGLMTWLTSKPDGDPPTLCVLMLITSLTNSVIAEVSRTLLKIVSRLQTSQKEANSNEHEEISL